MQTILPLLVMAAIGAIVWILFCAKTPGDM